MVRQRSKREQYWRQVLREQRASGLSVAAFCREQSVSVTSFYQWRRKLKLLSTRKAPTDKGVLVSDDVGRQVAMREEPQEKATTETPLPKFVPLELHSPPPPKQTNCEVVLPDGCRVMVPTQCDPNWLCEILNAVRSRTC